MAGKVSIILLFIMKYIIACINGPNLNLQGYRKKDFYGGKTLEDIYHLLSQRLTKAGGKLISFQSNHEGDIIDYLQKKKDRIDGIIINPGPLTFYGYALRDALVDTGRPFISVHLSNIYARTEQFRHTDIFADVAVGGIFGFKEYSYILALDAILNHLNTLHI